MSINKIIREEYSKFINEDIWLTQNQLAEIYKTTQGNISMHIKNIYKDNELSEI